LQLLAGWSNSIGSWRKRHPIGRRARFSANVVARFLASFKIWNEATVGGNILHVAPGRSMISLHWALEGVCTLWPRSGKPRDVPVIEFVTGNHAMFSRRESSCAAFISQ